MYYFKEMGNKIRHIMEQKNISSTDLVMKTRLSNATITAIMYGMRQGVSLGELSAIARALDIDLGELI